MAKICPLFSGSGGNSIYIGDSSGAVLIDAGRSARQIERALEINGLNSNKIHSVFVTHEHSDHVDGLKVFAKKHAAAVYGSRGTICSLIDKKIIDKTINYNIICGEIKLDGLCIKPFEISHDCSQGFGYVIKLFRSGIKTAICSDLGLISKTVFEAISGSDVVFIESNHDINMLKNGSYPSFLKQRILSDTGHLSNDACSKILPHLLYRGATRFILYHLSSKNNTPQAAFSSAVNSLASYNFLPERDFELYIAPEENFGKLKIVL